MSGEEPAGEAPDDPVVEVTWEEDGGYSRSEWMTVLLPALVLVSLVVLALVASYLLRDTGSEWHPLEDVDRSGPFDLRGEYQEEVNAYGPHSRSINLTLDRGDRLVLSFTSSGTSDGIQVRLQHPLGPTDGIDGTGGTEVFSSSAGANGTIDFFAREGGAYQLYFWHPGSARPPGPAGDPDLHATAAVTFDLLVTRGLRP